MKNLRPTNIPLKMRRNCNLDLRLVSRDQNNQAHDSSSMRSGQESNANENANANANADQLTVFYDGRIGVCNVTELQARAILYYARREMEDRMGISSSEPSTPYSLPSQLQSPATAASMQRSLRHFLKKRKDRNQATSPYNH